MADRDLIARELSQLEEPLRALIKRADHFACWQMKTKGALAPGYWAIDRERKLTVVPQPSDNKDTSVALIRALFEMMGVECYVFLGESWILEQKNAPDLQELRDISDHPERKEVVILIAESASSGMIIGSRAIIRTQRKPRLGPLRLKRYPHVEGRMSSLLPRTGMQS